MYLLINQIKTTYDQISMTEVHREVCSCGESAGPGQAGQQPASFIWSLL